MKKYKSLSLLLKYIKRHQARVAMLTFVYLVATVLFILAPQALSRFIDSAQNGDVWFGTAIAILLYLAAILARTIMSSVLNVQLTSVGQHITDDHRRDVMSHYLSLETQYLSGSTSGEIITRLDEDVQGLFSYYYVLIFKLAGSGVALIGILAALITQSGWLCAALFIVSIFAILGFKLIQDRGIPKYVRRSAAAASFNGTMKEILDNTSTLRALRAEDFAKTRIKVAMRHRYRESFPASLMYGNLWSASTIMQGVVVASGLLFALTLWDAGTISIGTAYLIYTYSEMVIEPLQDFRNHMGSMQNSRAGMMRTQELMDIPTGAVRNGRFLPDEPIALSIQGLSFSYKDGEDVLKNTSISVPAGKHLGIMGETGCGKSTLAGLIAGLNGYSRGSIKLNGMELRDIDSDNLFERVAYCTQRIQLIHGTLRDNITLFERRYTDPKIMDAIQHLNLTQWFQKFSAGLDTILEMGEGSLSSGETQLITLIRLALRNPSLMILDEITANLDASTEKRVSLAIAALCKGRTVIAIAHKAESLQWMDAVVRMENGALPGGQTYEIKR
ncbi:MAG: ABC transporter ATP-binding protein/permease [Clostridiales Family XIII bacterium]|jgi:ATP-binding cassette subfamily B protein|nr:ABC transporter ATP-binding protein/permease [Clostridiales Family XIII bacterium]